MKLYANNRLLAEQLLETAFAILRNEGLQSADCLALACDLLGGSIDVSQAQQALLQDCLLKAVALSEPPPVNSNEVRNMGRTP